MPVVIEAEPNVFQNWYLVKYVLVRKRLMLF